MVTTLAASFSTLLPTEENTGSGPEPGLLARAKNGDRLAFFQLFQAHAGHLYSLCLRITENVTGAENLTHDIFVEVFGHLDGVDDEDVFGKSLCRAAIDVLLKQGPVAGSKTLRGTQEYDAPKTRGRKATARPTLKLGQVQNFLRDVTPLLTADRPRIVFDFSQVCQIDSAGVDLLLYCVEQTMKRNGDLKLAAVPPASAVILELTQVDRLFEIFDTVAEAEDSFYRFSPASTTPLEGRPDGGVRHARLKSLSAL